MREERRCPIDTHTTDKVPVRTTRESIEATIELLNKLVEAQEQLADKLDSGAILNPKTLSVLLRTDASVTSTCALTLLLALRRM